MKAKKLAPPPESFMTPSWDLLKPNFELLKPHVEQLIYLFLLPALTYGLGGIMLGGTDNFDRINDLKAGRQEIGLIILIIGALWTLLNMAPGLYFRLKVATKRQAPSIGQCYREGLSYFWKLLGLYILFGLAVIGGLILLIVPGIIFFRRYYLAPYYLLDKDMGIIEAMKTASHDSKPVSGYVWGVIGVEAAFSLISSGVGLIPGLGIILSSLVGFATLCLPVLRYKEVAASAVAHD